MLLSLCVEALRAISAADCSQPVWIVAVVVLFFLFRTAQAALRIVFRYTLAAVAGALHRIVAVVVVVGHANNAEFGAPHRAGTAEVVGIEFVATGARRANRADAVFVAVGTVAPRID